MKKIIIYNVPDNQIAIYQSLNSFNFNIQLVSDPLSLDNVELSNGTSGVLIDGICLANAEIINTIGSFGIHYLFTRSAGFNNIDLLAAKKNNIVVANVPAYSPSSVAEMALTLGLTLYKRVAEASYNTHNADFTIYPQYFENEINSATVGIIGVGHIGSVEADLYHALGANVLGFQRHPDPSKRNVTFVSLKELLVHSDIISIHVPLIPSETQNMIGSDELSLMKPQSILINTSRAEVVDNNAVIQSIKDNHLGGFGTDVVLDEKSLRGRSFTSLNDIHNVTDKQLLEHYPKVLVTPHIAFLTHQAISAMATLSYQNFQNAFTSQPIKNVITK